MRTTRSQAPEETYSSSSEEQEDVSASELEVLGPDSSPTPSNALQVRLHAASTDKSRHHQSQFESCHNLVVSRATFCLF